MHARLVRPHRRRWPQPGPRREQVCARQVVGQGHRKRLVIRTQRCLDRRSQRPPRHRRRHGACSPTCVWHDFRASPRGAPPPSRGTASTAEAIAARVETRLMEAPWVLPHCGITTTSGQVPSIPIPLVSPRTVEHVDESVEEEDGHTAKFTRSQCRTRSSAGRRTCRPRPPPARVDVQQRAALTLGRTAIADPDGLRRPGVVEEQRRGNRLVATHGPSRELRACPGWGSNPHAPCGAGGFKPPASASSATRARTNGSRSGPAAPSGVTRSRCAPPAAA